jgi:hypothetical protein
MGMKRVVVHIDQLVLKGMRHEDRHGIADGLQQELSRVFSDRVTTSSFGAKGNLAQLRVGALSIEPISEGRRFKGKLAQNLRGELTK